MPYYRIVYKVQGKKNEISGIKWLEEGDIERVQLQMRNLGKKHYALMFEDVEVQMLSKSCSAVHFYLAEQMKKKEKRENSFGLPEKQQPYQYAKRRKDQYSKGGGGKTLGDRKDDHSDVN